MLDTRKLKNLKGSITALGLVDIGQTHPKAICGTGFFFAPQGYIMTADHVVAACAEMQTWFKKERGQDTEIVAFHLEYSTPRLGFHTDPIDVDNIVQLKTKIRAEGSVMPDNLDLAVLRLKKKSKPILHFLTFKEPGKLTLYEDVAMCGYPNSGQTLNFTTEFLGVRLSPVIQFGKIVGFMPIDEAPTPNGIQTDIVSTGGSSGSPIVDLISGKVIAIAQQVIVAPVYDAKGATMYFAKTGLVYGITNNVLYNVAKNVPAYFESGKALDFQFDHTSFTNPTFTRG